MRARGPDDCTSYRLRVMQRYALVTGLSDEEPANIELLHEGPQRPLGVGLNLPKHGRNYPYKATSTTLWLRLHSAAAHAGWRCAARGSLKGAMDDRSSIP